MKEKKKEMNYKNGNDYNKKEYKKTATENINIKMIRKKNKKWREKNKRKNLSWMSNCHLIVKHCYIQCLINII